MEAVLVVLRPGETIPVVPITVEIVADGWVDVEGPLDNVPLLVKLLFFALGCSIELWVINALKLEDGCELRVSNNVGTVLDDDGNIDSGVPSS